MLVIALSPEHREKLGLQSVLGTVCCVSEFPRECFTATLPRGPHAEARALAPLGSPLMPQQSAPPLQPGTGPARGRRLGVVRLSLLEHRFGACRWSEVSPLPYLFLERPTSALERALGREEAR